jgi:CRISPR-associated protein Csm3
MEATMSRKLDSIKLMGRVFVTFDIHVKTGLHIGGSDAGIQIGGVDNTVIRDPMTNRPYIPGSSLKGKMRSLLDKYEGNSINFPKGDKKAFHVCQTEDDYKKCDSCHVFGVSGEDFAEPTRLIVRDVFLQEKSAGDIAKAHTDLPYTEVKTEVSIDRITSEANPRPLERVPAGAIFGRAELVYSIYFEDDIRRLKEVFEAMRLIEDDYLGGGGSRGSGRVDFQKIEIEFRKAAMGDKKPIADFPSLGELSKSSIYADLKACL